MKKENIALKVFVLFIVGLFPIIFGVIFTYCVRNEDYETVVMSACTLIGGILDTIILGKEYNIKIKDKTRDISKRIIMLVIMLAIFYSTTSGCILNNSTYTELYGGSDSLSLLDWIAVGVFAPIGEELIYRLSIFSVIKDDNKKLNLTVAFVFSSVLFMIMHLQGRLFRNIDILLFGFVSALLFYATNNIVYSIIFHSISNFTVYGLALLFQKYAFNSNVLYISAPATVIISLIIISIVKSNYWEKNILR